MSDPTKFVFTEGGGPIDDLLRVPEPVLGEYLLPVLFIVAIVWLYTRMP